MMKKIWLLWVLFPFFLNAVQPSAQELFLQAHALYKEGNCAVALERYQAMNNAMNNKGAAVWYNMGNCYYRLNQYSQAYACWRRAQQRGPLYIVQSVEHNLSLMFEKVGKSYKQNRLYSYLCWAWSHMPPLIGQLTVLLLLLFVMIMIYYVPRYSRLFLTIAVCIVAGIIVQNWYARTAYKTGVVIPAELSVRAGPAPTYPGIDTLHELDELMIVDEIDKWYKIKHAHIKGWVLADSVEKI